MALLEVFADLAQTTVSSGGTTAPSAGTVESWTVSSSTSFPAVSAGATVCYVRDPAGTSELIAVTAISSTTWTVIRGANSTTPVAHSGGFTVIQVASADALNRYREWQFAPEMYGAKGDGQVVGDAVVTSGALSTVTSATAAFTSADTGKTYVLNGGQGTAAAPSIGTLTYVSATTCTMSTAAAGALTAGVLFWATDDGPALQDMASAMQTYALANNYRAQAILTGIYGAATLYQTTSGPGIYNTHLPVLPPVATGVSRQLYIDLIGPGRNGACDYFESAVPGITPGSVVSMVNAPGTANATYGQQSVIGGPTGSGAFTGAFANLHVTTQGIAVYSPAYPNQVGFDFANCAGWSWEECGAKTIQAPASNSPKYPDLPPQTGFQDSIGIGFRAPLVGNNDAVSGGRLVVEGYQTHGVAGDHFTCASLATIYQHISLLIDMVNGTSSSAHGITISNWSCEQYNGALKCNGGGSGFCGVNIFLDTETVSGSDPSYDVSDNGNLHGIIRITDAGARTSRTPVIQNGAPNLKVVNDMTGPGPWSSAPSAPATTVAQQNTAWRDAWIILSNTTAAITSISVGPASATTTVTGLVSTTALPVAIRVPSGYWWKATYASGTLVTNWFLD